MSEQSRILNQVMMKGYMDSALFYRKEQSAGTPADRMQEKENTSCQKAETDKGDCKDRAAHGASEKGRISKGI